ncbi:hypothetical protein BLNAU_13980 [Blattamonas nauphoetae]|uniref:Uncharacterized protein n=1 Tax=Blattamonas nauphoetae TaxID=2049346 RepID=A0ABQ9XH49_9EUKA|nr:hypothetical protein BLNAU_13980 [Blattamonas nauphoetae]
MLVRVGHTGGVDYRPANVPVQFSGLLYNHIQSDSSPSPKVTLCWSVKMPRSSHQRVWLNCMARDQQSLDLQPNLVVDNAEEISLTLLLLRACYV